MKIIIEIIIVTILSIALILHLTACSILPISTPVIAAPESTEVEIANDNTQDEVNSIELPVIAGSEYDEPPDYNPTLPIPDENAEMYEAYSRFLTDNYSITDYLLDSEDSVLSVDSGGLLDFDSDGLDDLVLIYRADESSLIQVCYVYSYKGGQITELFSEILTLGGNLFEYSIVHKEGKGALLASYYTISEGEASHAMGGIAQDFYVFENGELANKLGYYKNNYLSDWMQETANYQVWGIYRDDVEVISGTAPPNELIPEIEAIKEEAEALYGDEWKPLSIEELSEALLEAQGCNCLF